MRPPPTRATLVKKDVFDFEGQYGEEYEDLARRVIPGYETLFPMVAALLDPYLPVGGRVLVVGAGTGIELVTLKWARPDLDLHGVDPSRQMLDLARRRVEEAGNVDGITYQLGYAEDVVVPPLFDAATLINVLHFVPDDGSKASLLKSIAERVSPGGALVLFDLQGDPSSDEYAAYMPAWRRYWSIMGMKAEDKPAFDERIRTGIHFASPERTVALAQDAGFDDPRPFYKSLLYGGWTFRKLLV